MAAARTMLVRSPRTRGWSPAPRAGEHARAAFPAYAGVVPTWSTSPGRWGCVPRVRGGGPRAWRLGAVGRARSPRTRGWSLLGDEDSGLDLAFPAYAGVVPAGNNTGDKVSRVPRVRGGGPTSAVEASVS